MASKSKTKTTKPKDPTCQCGCDLPTRGGQFLPGHDAKLKSQLKSAAAQGDEDAEKELRARGWDLESLRAAREARKNAPPKQPKEKTAKAATAALGVWSDSAIEAEYKATCSRLKAEHGRGWDRLPEAEYALELHRARHIAKAIVGTDKTLQQYAVRPAIIEALLAEVAR